MQQIGPGTRICFNAAGQRGEQDDIVRVVIWQQTLMQQGVAFILTNHSWCWASDVIHVYPCEAELDRQEREGEAPSRDEAAYWSK